MRDRYIVFRELFDELAAEATGCGEHFTSKFGDDINLFEFPASVFNHFDDGGAFCAYASDGPFYVAAGVIVSIRAKDAGADCKLGVGAVGSAARFKCQGVHLLESEIGRHRSQTNTNKIFSYKCNNAKA